MEDKCEVESCENEAEFYDYMGSKICDEHRIQAMEEDSEQEDIDFEPISKPGE